MAHRGDGPIGYAIIANPISGNIPGSQKRIALADAAGILNAKIYGLNTRTRQEFDACAREAAGLCDVLVAAGGDGTFSQVINAVDTNRQPVSYLPLGSGNALRHALGFKGGLKEIALRIKQGPIREYDLIDCGGGRRAYNASIGVEGDILVLRDRYLAKGYRGFEAYARAAFGIFAGRFQRYAADITVDGRCFFIGNLVSLLVMKEPFYGYGMNMAPRARFDDGLLHLLAVTSGMAGLAAMAASAFLGGNRRGQYRTCRRLGVKADRALMLQTDGNTAWESREFNFNLLPGALKIKC